MNTLVVPLPVVRFFFSRPRPEITPDSITSCLELQAHVERSILGVNLSVTVVAAKSVTVG